MTKRIVVIDGHPDPEAARFCHAIAHAYADGAGIGGHVVKQLTLAHLNIPPLPSREEWEAPATGVVKDSQDLIASGEHLVIVYPLWLGAMPATLKAFLEQVFRHGFAITKEHSGLDSGLLRGKSARIIVTMGMPSLICRWYFGAYTLRSLDRNILRFSGFAPFAPPFLAMSKDEALPAAEHGWIRSRD